MDNENKNSLCIITEHLELLAKDENERDKLLSAARDNFINKRIYGASRIEQVRSKILDKIEDDVDNNKVNASQKIRYLEILSKINEADLNSFTGTNSGHKGGGITILNNNASSTTSDIAEKSKLINITSSNGENLVSNPAETQFLVEALEALKLGIVSTEDIKKKREENVE
jgi:hypothetical protein